MMYPVYVCDNFIEDGNILTLFDAKEVAKVETVTQYIQVYEELMAREIVPNAIICPNVVNTVFNIIFFK
jgi:hypothetical protein